MQATQKAKTRRGDDPAMTSIEEQCNREASHRYAKPPDQIPMFFYSKLHIFYKMPIGDRCL